MPRKTEATTPLLEALSTAVSELHSAAGEYSRCRVRYVAVRYEDSPKGDPQAYAKHQSLLSNSHRYYVEAKARLSQADHDYRAALTAVRFIL
jgi:hypothetical protein